MLFPDCMRSLPNLPSPPLAPTSAQVLFPDSYAHTSQWLHTVVGPAEEALRAAQAMLLRTLDSHPRFSSLAAGCVVGLLHALFACCPLDPLVCREAILVYIQFMSSQPPLARTTAYAVCPYHASDWSCLQLRARTKSLFSLMKKLLRLGDMSKGGRNTVFDLLGLRVVVQPRADMPPEQVRKGWHARERSVPLDMMVGYFSRPQIHWEPADLSPAAVVAVATKQVMQAGHTGTLTPNTDTSQPPNCLTHTQLLTCRLRSLQWKPAMWPRRSCRAYGRCGRGE